MHEYVHVLKESKELASVDRSQNRTRRCEGMNFLLISSESYWEAQKFEISLVQPYFNVHMRYDHTIRYDTIRWPSKSANSKTIGMWKDAASMLPCFRDYLRYDQKVKSFMHIKVQKMIWNTQRLKVEISKEVNDIPDHAENAGLHLGALRSTVQCSHHGRSRSLQPTNRFSKGWREELPSVQNPSHRCKGTQEGEPAMMRNEE